MKISGPQLVSHPPKQSALRALGNPKTLLHLGCKKVTIDTINNL